MGFLSERGDSPLDDVSEVFGFVMPAERSELPTVGHKTTLQWRHTSVPKPVAAPAHSAEGAGGQAGAVHRGQLGDSAPELENNLLRGLLWPF